MIRIFPALALTALLAACADGGVRFATPTVTAAESVPIRFPAVQMAEVRLPSYAASEEIFVQAEDGGLSPAPGMLWADLPGRAITLALTRNLSEITGARVAPEPWPFESLPDARVEVQIEDLIARADGTVTMSGQFFVATARDGRDSAGHFTLKRAYAANAGAAGIAQARAEITLDLALLIAREGLR